MALSIDIDKIAANLYWNRTPWSRKPGFQWDELQESTREGWRQQALRLLIKQGLLTEETRDGHRDLERQEVLAQGQSISRSNGKALRPEATVVREQQELSKATGGPNAGQSKTQGREEVTSKLNDDQRATVNACMQAVFNLVKDFCEGTATVRVGSVHIQVTRKAKTNERDA